MIRNYLKTAWRNILNNKVASLINIGGLAIGLAAGIISLAWINNELNYNKIQTNLADIHLVMSNQKEGDGIETYPEIPATVAPVLRNEIAELKYVARVSAGGPHLLGYGDKSMYENGMYVEPDFFKITSFSVVKGDPVAAMQSLTSVVISERTAKKLFGNEDPIGKLVRHNNQQDLQVGAVVEDISKNSTIKFDVALPFRLYELQNSDNIDRWDYSAIFTWVQFNPNVRLDRVNAKLKNIFRQKQNDETRELFAYSLNNLSLRGEFRNGKPTGGRINLIILLGTIGAFVLLIACINFMNLATARSLHRSKEVGVRKVMGASKKRVILQFLIEATLITFFALIVGVILAKLAMPGLSRFVQRDIEYDLLNWKIWLMVLGVGLLTSLVAGSYPAFYLSSFNPVKVLKGGTVVRKGTALLRKGLVTFQFIISIFLIICTIVVFQQLRYSQNRPLGYNPKNLIDIPIRGDAKSNFEIIKNELLQIQGIRNISAGTDNIVRFNSQSNGVNWPGKTSDQDYVFTSTDVYYDWTTTIGLKVIEGRDFSREYGSDTSGCLLNQAAVKIMNLKQPVVGTLLGQVHVVGVVEDFIYNNPYNSPMPMIIYLAKNSSNLNHLFVSLSEKANPEQMLTGIEKVVKKSNPNYPFEFKLTQEEFQRKFEEMQSTGKLINTVGILAIFISYLGLFALSAFLAEKKMKEIGIRKVLGASSARIWLALSRDLLKPVAIAFLLASPLAAFAMHEMLTGMEYHVDLAWWVFALAGVLSFSIALITVSFQGLKAAFSNPIKSIRTE
jgi:putative ABC transport system permease protein